MDYTFLLDKIPWEIGVKLFSKAYSFWKKKIGVKKAKKKLSLAYQECLKENPNMSFINRTLTEYEGKKYLRADLKEIKDVTKKVGTFASQKKQMGLKLTITAKDAISQRGKVFPATVSIIHAKKVGVKIMKRGIPLKGADLMVYAPDKKNRKAHKKT